MRPLLAAPAALALLACSPAPPPVAQPAPKPPPPHATAAPTASAEASAEPPPPAPQPLPKLDTPQLDEQLAFLSTLCKPAVRRDAKGAQQVGCATCLTYGPESAAPDGTVAMDPEEFYALESLVYGSFSKPGADEAAATLSGCESHAENWGGTLLAERKGGAWSMVRYDSGVHPASCVPFRRKDGRDILVCRWVDGHQSYWHDKIFAYDFAKSTADDISLGWAEIVTMDDDLVPGCGSAPGTSVQAGHVEDYKVTDLDKDGTLDLLVTVSLLKGKTSKAFEKKCKELFEALEKEGAPDVNISSVLGKARVHELGFTFDGAKFVPTAKTAKLLKTF